MILRVRSPPTLLIYEEIMICPICFRCRCEMRCEKNSQIVCDTEACGFPSTYWVGDVFKCPECSSEVVVGFSDGFLKEEWEAMGRDVSEAVEFRYR